MRGLEEEMGCGERGGVRWRKGEESDGGWWSHGLRRCRRWGMVRVLGQEEEKEEGWEV